MADNSDTFIEDVTAHYVSMDAWMLEESSVNGMWNAILNNVFPMTDNEYLICPEVRTTNHTEADIGGYRADFVVYKIAGNPGNLSRKATVVFEGKATRGDTWSNVLGQCISWAHSQSTSNFTDGTSCLLIGAIGSKAKLWLCRREGKGNNRRDVKTIPLIFNVSKKMSDGTEDSQDAGYEFDLTNDDHRRRLSEALEHAAGNLPEMKSWKES